MAAWEDLDRSQPPGSSRDRVGLYVATTGGYYVAQAHALDVPEAERPGLVAAVAEQYREDVAGQLVDRLVSLSKRAAPNAARVFVGQQAAFAAALGEAVVDLRAGKVDEAVVGAIDSLVDGRVISALARLGLIKSPDNPAGIAPGEGAAFIRLTRPSSTSQARPALGSLEQVAWATENTHRFSATASDEKALLGILAAAPPSVDSGATPLIVGTLNGDPLRAMEWGAALVSLPAWARSADHLYPAVSFGDTGTAAVAMNVVFALRILARTRVSYQRALIWASGDDGGKAVIWVQPATGRRSVS